MSLKRKKFGMRWRGRLHKLVSIAGTKSGGIISADPITDGHTYYPPDGKIHITIEEKTTQRKKRFFGKIPSIQELGKPEVIDELQIESAPYDILPDYEIVDVDSFNCKDPFVQVYACPPNEEKIKEIKLSHRGEKRIVKFPNVWIIVAVMDNSQKI